MASYTNHYHLLELNPGTSSSDTLALNGYEFTATDRVVIDALLYIGAESHHHTGILASSNDPSSVPSLVLSSSGGSLPAGTVVYYEYTYVDPNGLETAPSPVASVTTQGSIGTPSAPSLAFSAASGSLTSGSYLYCVTAYVTLSTEETLASLSAAITISSTGEIVLTFPTLPSGATGWNIYKMGPGASQFQYLATVASGPSTYTDNGSVPVNCNRSTPNSNTTIAASSVAVTVLAPPTGYTWNLYRTLASGNWGNTLIAANQPITSLTFTDTGTTPIAGTPPTASRVPGSPSKILLTNGAEVQGVLPNAMVDLSENLFPQAITFTFAGSVSAVTGVMTWPCPFAAATILGARASLGRGSVPAVQAVIADVLKGSGTNPTYTSIYAGATPNPKPQVPVGQQVGVLAPPVTTTLVAGDTLGVDIDQAGGGATPTDHDLTVTIFLLATNH